jgi:hypothetical protein
MSVNRQDWRHPAARLNDALSARRGADCKVHATPELRQVFDVVNQEEVTSYRVFWRFGSIDW